MRIPMSGRAEGLMFLASRQYERGGDVILETTYGAHVHELQDALWALAMEFRQREDLEAIRGPERPSTRCSGSSRIRRCRRPRR